MSFPSASCPEKGKVDAPCEGTRRSGGVCAGGRRRDAPVRRTLTTQVLVVGGGINGAGIARDLALRGVRVALVEKGELGGGTSWASSGMIHGGLRYLQKDPQVTLHSCVDSGNIQRIAPHLIFRIPFLMPVFRDDPIGPELVEIGLEMYDQFQPFKRGKPIHVSPASRHCALSPRSRRRSSAPSPWMSGVSTPRAFAQQMPSTRRIEARSCAPTRR